MANQYVNKVVVGGETKLDLTGDTVVADKLAKGYKAHDKSGAPIVGTNTYDADTGDLTPPAEKSRRHPTGATTRSRTGSAKCRERFLSVCGRVILTSPASETS